VAVSAVVAARRILFFRCSLRLCVSAVLSDFRQEHQLLLKAQVVLTDRMDKLADRMDKLAASQQHTDERLNALIGVVDGVVRRIPPE